MKIVVTSKGTGLESEVDARFGRARYFLVVDTESGEFVTVDNEQNLNATQGAGIQAARKVSETGAEAVVTGNVGPRAFATLNAAGIKVYISASGTVAEAVEQFKSGILKPTDGANVESHWTGS